MRTTGLSIPLGGFMRRSAAGIVATLLLLAGVPDGAAAQRRTPAVEPAGPPGQTSVTIEAKIDGKRYRASGRGDCRHAPEASIRDVPASLWMVHYTNPRAGGLKQLSMTLWRPKDDGPDQLSLLLDTKSGSHRIETGQEGKSAGQGSVTVLPSGPGGRLEITGKEAEGKPVQVTIDCSVFSGVEAEGG
jgi:hypothetical protein